MTSSIFDSITFVIILLMIFLFASSILVSSVVYASPCKDDNESAVWQLTNDDESNCGASAKCCEVGRYTRNEWRRCNIGADQVSEPREEGIFVVL
jgi:hypothetical protein